MTTRIYKYPLTLTDRQRIRMPTGARMLTALLQDETICLWAEVEADRAAEESREIVIIGTGHTLPPADPLHYINTVIDGRFVWHVYTVGTK